MNQGQMLGVGSSGLPGSMGNHPQGQASQTRAQAVPSHIRILWKVIHQEGDSQRFGRRSNLAWPEELAEIRLKPNSKVQQEHPVAAVSQLQLPAGCQADLARLLQSLAKDPRKHADIRDLRIVGLRMPEAATALELSRHPSCGLLQLALEFKFVAGRVHNQTVETQPVNDALLSLLASKGVSQELCHLCWETTQMRSTDENACCWVTVRTDSAESAQALKQDLESSRLSHQLQAEVKIAEVLPNSPTRAAFHSEQERGNFDLSLFAFELKELRVIGGRILDVIDPSRASIDPMHSKESFFPEKKPQRPAEPDAWTIPAIPEALCRRFQRARPSAHGAPRWLPAVLRAYEARELQFASEISGIPWLGPGTLCSCIYRRLGELLTAMQPLFAQLAPQPQFLHRPLGPASQVLVKAQIYEVRSGEEILGELHQEGVDLDRIAMVGLYYPVVDDALTGGDLEITVVMSGGCGSQYPVSQIIPVQAGTAIAFDNHEAYHRMTALRAAPGQAGRRLVVAFFVLSDSHPSELSTESVCVNYADKARSMVRRTAGQPRHKLPKHVQVNIEQFLSGGESYAQQRFEASRRARARPLSREGLVVRAMD